MFFHLIIGESEYLHPVGEGSLGGADFRKEVHYLLMTGEYLLDIIVCEVDNRIPISPDSPAHVVREHDFPLP